MVGCVALTAVQVNITQNANFCILMTFMIMTVQATTPCRLCPPPWVQTPSLCLSGMSRVLTGQLSLYIQQKVNEVGIHPAFRIIHTKGRYLDTGWNANSFSLCLIERRQKKYLHSYVYILNFEFVNFFLYFKHDMSNDIEILKWKFMNYETQSTHPGASSLGLSWSVGLSFLSLGPIPS